MSLIKKQNMTEKSLAAHRRNGKLSRGPATVEGKARCQEAKMGHGFYSQSEEAALRTLGEDPADFRAVLEGLRATWPADNPAQAKVINCLAQTLCRIELAEHARQGHLLRQAKAADDGRETRIHAQMMHLKMNIDYLWALAEKVAEPHFVATLQDLKKINGLKEEGVMEEMGEIVVALFYRLREPGTPGLGEPGEGVDQEEQQRRVLIRIKEIFGLADDDEDDKKPTLRPAQPGQQNVGAASPEGTSASSQPGESQPGADGAVQKPAAAGTPAPKPNPYPNITGEEWERREPARQLLENLLNRQIEIYEARRQALLKELVAGPSLYERAAEITPSDSYVKLMQRVEDSNLRQASRLIALLEKMKRQARPARIRKKTPLSGYVSHKKRR